jgi:hypothetical protein
LCGDRYCGVSFALSQASRVSIANWRFCRSAARCCRAIFHVVLWRFLQWQ